MHQLGTVNTCAEIKRVLGLLSATLTAANEMYLVSRVSAQLASGVPRCADGESGPVLYVRSSAQVVHVQYVFDTGIRTYVVELNSLNRQQPRQKNSTRRVALRRFR